MTHRPGTTTAFVVALAITGLSLLGVGGAPIASAKGNFPRIVRAANGAVRILARPKRVVSLSPTATEMLFAVGAGAQVVAVDDQSNFPSKAPKTKLSGFQPNLEAIAGYKPDLVLVANDPKELVAGLTKLKIPVLLLPSAVKLTDSYTQIQAVGAATGHSGEATLVVSRMQSRVAKIVASVPKRTAPLTYFHELDNTLYTVTSKTFIGSMYDLAGLRNIADAADKDGSGYPQLNAEYVIAQNPDLVFLADTKCCKQDAKAVASRPGWDSLKSVKNGGVVALDDDIASRWGPRVVDLLQAIVNATSKAPKAAAA